MHARESMPARERPIGERTSGDRRRRVRPRVGPWRSADPEATGIGAREGEVTAGGTTRRPSEARRGEGPQRDAGPRPCSGPPGRSGGRGGERNPRNLRIPRAPRGTQNPRPGAPREPTRPQGARAAGAAGPVPAIGIPWGGVERRASLRVLRTRSHQSMQGITPKVQRGSAGTVARESCRGACSPGPLPLVAVPSSCFPGRRALDSGCAMEGSFIEPTFAKPGLASGVDATPFRRTADILGKSPLILTRASIYTLRCAWGPGTFRRPRLLFLHLVRWSGTQPREAG
jgi:hypothetical protein